MADLNRVSLMGRLGADPEIRVFDNGDKVANLRVATGERWKDKQTGEAKERTEWHAVVIYGPAAGMAEKYLRKGARCLIEGALRTRKWQDQQGNDRYSTEVVVSGYSGRVDPIDWPENGGGGAARGQDDAYGDLPGARGNGGYDQSPEGHRGGGYGGGSGGGQTGGNAGMDDEIPF